MKNENIESTTTRSQRNSQRGAWIELAKRIQPRLFLTLKFRFDALVDPEHQSGRNRQRSNDVLTKESALEIANELIHRIHQRLFGRSKFEEFLGVGCVEFQQSGMPHIHLLVSNDIDAERLISATRKVLLSARRHGKPFFLLDPESLDVREVFDDEGIVNYVTKLFEHMENGEQMLLLHSNVIQA